MSTQQQAAQLRRHFAELVRDLYKLGDGRDGSRAWQECRGRVQGFSEAAQLLKLLSLDEVQQIIDEAHLEILGEPRLARRERLEGIGAKVERGDWDEFDKPAYERYRCKY